MKILCVGIIKPEWTYIERRITRPVEAVKIVRRGTDAAAWREIVR